MVAVPTSKLLRSDRNGVPHFRTELEMKEGLKLGARTTVLALSVEKDPALEAYWRSRNVRDLKQRLCNLGIQYAVAPDFSMAVNLPRFDHLANRRRSLICAEEMSAVGISVVPYIAAVAEKDWEFWVWFLREHPQIVSVCKEFQTGARNHTIAAWHLQHMRDLEQKLGRGLHVFAVGGRRYLNSLLKLNRVTIVDSSPFIKAIKRRALQKKGVNWIAKPMPKNRPIDRLLEDNVRLYANYIHERCTSRVVRADERQPQMRPVASTTPTMGIEDTQLSLPWGA
jgi:hypothetical protein